MAKRENQKLKLLYLYKIMREKTSADNGLSLPAIQEELKKYNILANRQVLYEDFKALRAFGQDIKTYGKGSKTRYYLERVRFEPAELKILIDAVQASRFLTKNKTYELVRKLALMNGNKAEDLLNRQVYVSGRIKNMNDSIYDTTDIIHRAINNNKMIKFKYYFWNTKKKLQPKHEDKTYEVSPWALFWDRDKYYLVAYDFSERKIKHFRVDKMLYVSQVDKKRKGITAFSKLDKSTYTQKHFGMFGGEEVTVTLECANDLSNAIVDRFGRGVKIVPIDDEKFTVDVTIIMSDKFLAWVVALGEGCKIIGPDTALEKMRLIKERLCKDY